MTLERFDQETHNVNREMSNIPLRDIRVHMTYDIRKVGDSRLLEHAKVFAPVRRQFVWY